LDYARAGRKAKTAMLDEFVAATGVNRKTAIGLLTNPPPARARPRGRRKRRYGTDVAAAVELLWATTGYVCSKRLAPFLLELAEMMREAGEWGFSDSVMGKLPSISASTCERLLRPHKASRRVKGRCMTKPGTMLKAQIPIRTHADWVESEPGYCEMDLVHHCDQDTSGEYLHTLTVTDVATGWTELQALKNRSQHTVECGIKSMASRLPFPLRGLDSDSGSEFINVVMFRFCQDRKIVFTRSRPNHKNDQCHVEQKNWSVVRQNVGYDRFEGEEASRALNEFFRALRLQVNFLQPSMALVGKERSPSAQDVRQGGHSLQTRAKPREGPRRREGEAEGATHPDPTARHRAGYPEAQRGVAQTRSVTIRFDAMKALRLGFDLEQRERPLLLSLGAEMRSRTRPAVSAVKPSTLFTQAPSTG